MFNFIVLYCLFKFVQVFIVYICTDRLEELTRNLIGPQGLPGIGQQGKQGIPGVQGIPGSFE